MAAPTTYITTIKRFTYRGDANEEFSNSYAFTGATPADSAAWRALFDALALSEKTLLDSGASIIGAYGYNKIPAKGDHAIWSVDLTVTPNTPVAGTYTSGGFKMSGDQAAWVRWGLDRFNPYGKRVYLRKYFHTGGTSNTNPDALDAGYVTRLNTYAALMWGGAFAGTRRICDKDGNTPIGAAVSPYVTTRTLKRRGKRPPT